MAPFWRIQCSAALVSRPPENAMPTFWPTGRCSRMVLMGFAGSAEVADVVIGLRDTDFETGIGGNAELVARAARLPEVAPGQPVLAAAGHALHGFRGAGLEGQLGRQD